MKYDFDTVIERHGTNSMKYDFARERGKPDGLLPLWVADMDFPAPPEVLVNIHKSVSHGIFGYTEVKNDYYDAVIDWFDSRFSYRLSANEIIKTPGVVFALVQAIRACTRTGDAVMIQTPVYHPFYEIVRDNERTLVTNPLVYKDGKYFIDFEDFERKIIDHDVKLFILCNPHNPVGRVWTRSELATMNEICERRGVIVVSDEIHCDFVWPRHTHTCFGVLNENAVIATAPSKTFNLAGLQTSHLFIKNAELRNKLKAELGRSGYSQLNTLGLVACQSAYTHGGAWLEALNSYLTENIRFAREFLAARLPRIHLVEPEGTYLLWLDFSDYALTQKELDRRVTENARLWLSSGTGFGQDGEGFQRINIACPRATLAEALSRLEKEFK
ncbi:MAG: pyridoxal phosphate-dependent aminotransferase [Burkholderiales bacterium]|jgi:cystathionine beta-lyase|nr:pyridoxal phosphate-dependent aminotransferase [Burkholderiales bacterium]